MWTIAFPSSKVGYVFPSVMGNADVIKTTDGGETWTQIFGITGPAEGFGVMDCSFPDVDHGFIVTGEGSVYRTTNGGLNWSSVFHTDYYSMEGIWFISPDTGYAAGAIDDCWGTDCGLLIKTVNGGNTWDYRYFDSECYDIFFTDRDTGFLTSDHIYKTTDKGYSWYPDTSNLTGGFRKIHFPTPQIGYVEGGYWGGSALWKRDPDIGVYSSLIPPGVDLIVFPVPATEQLSFSFFLPSGTNVIIDLYNEHSILLKHLFTGMLPAGRQLIYSNIKGMTPGFYFCRVITSEGATVKKILIAD
jgi:hypothetical protein